MTRIRGGATPGQRPVSIQYYIVLPRYIPCRNREVEMRLDPVRFLPMLAKRSSDVLDGTHRLC